MALIVAGILITSVSFFSMWGGTPIPLGVVGILTGLATIVWGLVQAARDVVAEEPADSQSP